VKSEYSSLRRKESP
jgi:hypothetical protein